MAACLAAITVGKGFAPGASVLKEYRAQVIGRRLARHQVQTVLDPCEVAFHELDGLVRHSGQDEVRQLPVLIQFAFIRCP